MKTIFRTYQFELMPTQEQKTLLDKHFGCIRYVYNHFLNEGLKIYRQELAITKVERKLAVSNNAHSMKPEAHPIASGVGG
jgi:transposase